MTSFLKLFRLIFVIFFLYLLGDAFYRWDGFRYHSSFSEFLPSVAFVSILWCMVACFAVLITWVPLKGLESFCERFGLKRRFEILLMFVELFILLLLISSIGKRMLIKEPLSILSKLIILSLVFLITAFFIWKFRNKTNIVHERITPLVWLFSIWILFSLPIVTYSLWKQSGETDVKDIDLHSGVEGPNIILITFDAMTSLDMSVYGYYRDATPFIKSWARNATVFAQAKSADNWTTPSAKSLMTGKRPWTHGLYNIGSIEFKRNDRQSLPWILKNNGYTTIALVSNIGASPETLGIKKGFDIDPASFEFAEPVSIMGGV